MGSESYRPYGGLYVMLIFVVIVSLAIYLILRNSNRTDYQPNSHASTRLDPVSRPALPYRRRDAVFNRSEMAYFVILRKRIPDNFSIFPKIRIADFIDVTPGAYYYDYNPASKKIIPKHVDFLIVDENFKPVMAIEVNGRSHLSEKRQQSDRFKKEIFESVGLSFEVVRVGDDFFQDIDRVISRLKTSS